METNTGPSIVSPGALIATGRTAEVYAWGEDRILKLYYTWCPLDWAQHEVVTGRAISGKALPTPKLLDSVTIDGRAGIIYERVEGPSMLAVLTKKPWRVNRLARLLAELQTEVHRLSGEGLPSLRASLSGTIQRVENLPPTLKDYALGVLASLPDGSALCHFDFHPAQVILTPKGPVIIDWMTALQGHPLADVARTSILFKVAQVPGAGRATRTMVDLLRGQLYRSYLRRYLELNPGTTREEIDRWMVPVAAAASEGGDSRRGDGPAPVY